MRSNDPLFIRFANDRISAVGIMETFLSTTKCEKTKEIVSSFLEEEEPDISQFRADFQNCLEDIIDKGADPYVRGYLNNYMEPALLEFKEESSFSSSGNQSQWVGIRKEDAPWIEALVCYNLCLFIKGMDWRHIKRCPVCQTFFCNKGKYAKYCSDSCKTRGG